jgi:putative membrane protein
MAALYLKAIHIIFVVTWFAGLFYMPRLLIYRVEAQSKGEPEKSILTKQLSIMASRLWYIITWPSAIITLCMGTSLLVNQPEWLTFGFMHVKLGLVFLLYLYQVSIHIIFNQQQKGVFKYSSQQLRVWNEVGTLFLIAIVFLVVLKDTVSMLWGILGLVILMIVMLITIRIYKIFRKNE